MKAVICEKYGPPEVLKLRDIPKPVPRSNEILVKVKATAVNSGDVRMRGLQANLFLRTMMRFIIGFRGPRNSVLGGVLSGTVEHTGGNVTRFKPGDNIFAMTGMKFGGYAEYAVLKESGAIALMPATATFEQAAVLPFGGSTALYFLRKAGVEDTPGQNVLIYGASGAVGTAAIQVATHFGARVTAVCSGQSAELVKSLGADQVIDYTTQDFLQSNEKYDIIVDAVGKISKKDCSTLLTNNGKYVTVGSMDVDNELSSDLELLATLYDTNKFHAVIDRTYPLEQIVDAHTYVDQGHKHGNVAITVSHK